MNPFKLCREGTAEPIAQACGACGTVYRLGDMFRGDREAIECCDTVARRAREAAEAARRHADFRARAEEQERERIAKATRVPEADYAGPVFTYDGDESARDGFFGDIGGLAEAYEDDGRPLPAEVWACTVRRFRIDDAQESVGREIEGGDWHEDMGDWVTGVDTLWDIDYSRRVVLSPEADA